jgi:hypothetical protein
MSKLGFWSAAGPCIASLAYGVPQILQVAGLLPDPPDRIVTFAPSLILAPFVVVALAAFPMCSLYGAMAHDFAKSNWGRDAFSGGSYA